MKYITESKLKIGGSFKTCAEDFIVEEIPLVEFAGTGEHTFVLVEKRNVSTLEAVKRICRAVNYPVKNVGFAGFKDAKAVARQYLSFQNLAEDKFQNLEIDDVKILDIKKSNRKLRRGQLRGNKFTCIIRNAEPGALSKAREILEVLKKRGLPNYFGEQRFGIFKNNQLLGEMLVKKNFKALLCEYLKTACENGLELIEKIGAGNYRAALEACSSRKSEPRKILGILARTSNPEKAVGAIPRKIRQLYISAFQSHLFNLLLDERIAEDAIDKVFPGDIAYLHRNGAAFLVEDPDAENKRVQRFEISPSGAIFGTKSLLAEKQPGERERAMLARYSLTLADFKLSGGLTQKGARRPYRVSIGTPEIEKISAGLKIKFSLPAGAYATNLLLELIKPD